MTTRPSGLGSGLSAHPRQHGATRGHQTRIGHTEGATAQPGEHPEPVAADAAYSGGGGGGAAQPTQAPEPERQPAEVHDFSDYQTAEAPPAEVLPDWGMIAVGLAFVAGLGFLFWRRV